MKVCELSLKQVECLKRWMEMSPKQKYESLDQRQSVVYFQTQKTIEQHGRVPCGSCTTGEDVMTIIRGGSFPTVYSVPDCWGNHRLGEGGHLYLHIEDVYPAMLSGSDPDNIGDFMGKVEHLWVTFLEGWNSGG